MRRGKAESTPSPPAVATAELQETIFLDKAVEEDLCKIKYNKLVGFFCCFGFLLIISLDQFLRTYVFNAY